LRLTDRWVLEIWIDAPRANLGQIAIDQPQTDLSEARVQEGGSVSEVEQVGVAQGDGAAEVAAARNHLRQIEGR
jgi:hypothetical protein